MTSKDLKHALINDIIVNGLNSSIELENRIDNIIMLAQNERAMEINNAMFPDVIGTSITEPEIINPEDMVKGEWYVNDCIGGVFKGHSYLFKFDYMSGGHAGYDLMICISEQSEIHDNDSLYVDSNDDTIRKATREEVTKYFPTEFDKEIAPFNQI